MFSNHQEGIILQNEDFEHSCKTNLYFIEKFTQKYKNDKFCLSLLQDLAWKSVKGNLNSKNKYLLSGLCKIYQRTLEETLGSFSKNISIEEAISHNKKLFDVGIVTIKREELEGVLLALGMDSQKDHDLKIGSRRYWFSKVEKRGGGDLSIIITMVNRPRNVPCAMAVDSLLSNFGVNLLILVGVAAGLKEKDIKLGEVIGADLVLDYEHSRLEKDEDGVKIKLFRPEQHELPFKIQQNLTDFKPDNFDFESKFQKLLMKLDKKKKPPSKKLKDLKPKYEFATVAAGEKLIADGSIVDMRFELHERIRAADQEDSGFVKACIYRDHPVLWAVFRGISDQGEANKEYQKKENWQYLASLSAATVALLFLQNSYSPASE